MQKEQPAQTLQGGDVLLHFKKSMRSAVDQVSGRQIRPEELEN